MLEFRWSPSAPKRQNHGGYVGEHGGVHVAWARNAWESMGSGENDKGKYLNHPFEKYAHVKLDHLIRDQCKNKKIFETTT